MDYLVEMTTHVPDGTPESAVDDIRSHEAVRARELAAEGRLLRLWRPPLAPGEWRTFGLFTAPDAGELETALASMPLRIWRTDVVTPLSVHPNDPHSVRGRQAVEFLTILTLTIPAGTPDQKVDDLKAREALRAQILAEEGRLVRLWTPPTEPGQWRTFGLWSANDANDLDATLASLPLHSWMTIETTPLSAHPSDPAAAVTP